MLQQDVRVGEVGQVRVLEEPHVPSRVIIRFEGVGRARR